MKYFLLFKIFEELALALKFLKSRGETSAPMPIGDKHFWHVSCYCFIFSWRFL